MTQHESPIQMDIYYAWWQHETGSCSHPHLWFEEIIPLTLRASSDTNYILGFFLKNNLLSNLAPSNNCSTVAAEDAAADTDEMKMMKRKRSLLMGQINNRILLLFSKTFSIFKDIFLHSELVCLFKKSSISRQKIFFLIQYCISKWEKKKTLSNRNLQNSQHKRDMRERHSRGITHLIRWQRGEGLDDSSQWHLRLLCHISCARHVVGCTTNKPGTGIP